MPPDAPYKKRDHKLNTKLKEPVVVISEDGKESITIMGLRYYIYLGAGAGVEQVVFLGLITTIQTL